MDGRPFKLEASSKKRLPRKLSSERKSVKHKKHITLVSIPSPSCVINLILKIVDDGIVIDLVSKQIKGFEAKGQSWIIQGFPRTKAQALALQKMGIIPDKFILLKCKQTASISRLKNNLLGINQQLFGPDLEELAANCLKEHELNLKGVREAFN